MLLKVSDILKIKVIPNSQHFAICGFNSWDESFRVKVQSQATKGKANKELLEKLRKLLGCKIEIVQGKSNREKLLKVKGKSPEEVLELLKAEI